MAQDCNPARREILPAMCRLKSRSRCLIGLLAGLATIMAGRAAADDRAGVDFFEQKIRPVLVKECYACHSKDSKALKGGLRLDTREGLTKGGDSGPAIVGGKPDESLLLDALRHDGIDMPPKGKLPDAVIGDFERWVKMGAPDPRMGVPSPASSAGRRAIDIDAGRKFWAYQLPRWHQPPAVRDHTWPSTDIDHFLLSALEARNVFPAPDADRATLARRVSFDLIGLPPTPGEIDAFVNDPSPAAYESLVDRLLASPHFGERWGRHWLDVVRFAESLTLRGFILPPAWRFRDHVINAFNADMPFDQFVREQVAGDLLPALSIAERRRQQVAASFLVLGNTNLEDQDKNQLVMDVVDEQLDTIGRAFLAQTLGCARCHDHKFDPIPTRDYYALAGILRNVKTLKHANVSMWLEKPLAVSPEQEAVLKKHEQQVAGLESQLKAERGHKGPHVAQLAAELARLKARGPVREMTLAVEELAAIVDARVNIRGSVHNLGEPVVRGFLQVATVGEPPRIPSTESGRRELAQWLASANNPLTARVVVNRVWQWLFGVGIVRTPDNFGTTGERPSHPELLDYLAIRFIDEGWSIKRLIRAIVLSRAYRLSTVDDPRSRTADPENRLAWRANRVRLDAECLRDAVLAAAGDLRLEMGGPTFPASLKADYGYVSADRRRSVYLPVFRNALPEVFEVFDFADPSMVTGRRNVSTVAPQALFLMNHPFVITASRATARRLLAETNLGDQARLTRLYRLTLGRPPTDRERAIGLAFASAGGTGSSTPEETWAMLVQALFGSLDFRYR
jgi:cytochrome c553